MMNDKKHSRAEYDANGNIILRGDAAVEKPAVVQARMSRVHKEEVMTQNQWTTLEEQPHKVEPAPKKIGHAAPAPKHSPHPARRLSTGTKSLFGGAMREGAAQYSDAAAKAREHAGKTLHSIRSLPSHAKRSVRGFWRVANTPLFVRRRTPRKQRSRTTLFLMDTVRFGGTFGLIFATLFVAINYQSFWQIAKSALALNVDTQTEQALQEMVKFDMTKPSAATQDPRRKFEADSLLTYLPKVGPFENRLVIPKIGKNVPIVQPGMEALMKEDWKKFEEDVQSSLHHGVVHYPGSAAPGNPGNFFITGHSSYYPWDDGQYKDVFARLHELDVGDLYSVYYGGDLHMYKIVEKKEVRPSDVSVLDQPTGERLATLMTCTPIGTTLRRLIVIAQEIDPASGMPLQIGERGTDSLASKTKPAVKMEALPI
jgi:LPXTG-site transpeptidase (sortase) family protein